ncbi:uncharacterized protein LOC106662269 isoform X1 [Cimex lectularius]|uniref:Beta-1,3-glucan-binding protein n=1 Tax=Cimex lectularius TaxID=79782 RepID=A0A8I6RDE2_CIMLE|nr:uncharacterized protein LOC106662269 isoform X1 [Cimex lectularius]
MMHGISRWKASIFTEFLLLLAAIGVDGTLTYLGCFREQTKENRLFKGDHKDFNNILSPQICANYCEQRGFKFIGLQYSYECFCSNTRPTFHLSAYENECNMQCAGNVHDICGGGLRLSVYESDNAVAGVTTLTADNSRYVGCFKEISAATRLLPNEQKNFVGDLTVEKCISHCLSKGFDYAGTQYGFECFCSQERPSFKRSANEETCNKPCDGNKHQICGGNWRLSVYETTEQARNPVSSNYIGCFYDSNLNRLLVNAYKDFDGKLTPEACVSFCYRGGYRYAGVQHKSNCYCGSEVPLSNKRSQETECDLPCPGDGSIYCGGSARSSVYYTEITDYSEDDRLLGCYKDSDKNRILSGERLVFNENNTPRLCMNTCLSLNYKFSGVQYGNECYCGNRRPPRDLEVAERDCLTPCPGDKRKKCGGGWRLLVFEVPDVNTEYPRPNERPVLVAQTTQKPTTQRATQRTTQRTTTKAPATQKTTKRNTYRPTTRQPNRETSTKPPTKYTTYKPTLLNNKPDSQSNANCVTSLTIVNGKSVCKGDLIFKENFDESLSKEKWAHEILMPWLPDYEFIVLRKGSANSYVEYGKFHVKPTLQDDEFIRKGKLELYGCTRVPSTLECERQAAAFNILPPVESARITTKYSFSFKYGKVNVRAKLPLGDWIIPEIWLEPKRKVYGPSYTSGRIRIAMARGNRNLQFDGQEIGNSHLESGVLMGIGNNIRGRTITRQKSDGWYRNFHNYTVIWSPDELIFLVDGEQQESILRYGSTLAELVGFDENSAKIWKSGSRIAPFDQEFYLSFGLSVGGMRDFPDNSISSGKVKPWKNSDVKAMANFWESRHDWKSSWEEEKAKLQIEHIRVYAL